MKEPNAVLTKQLLIPLHVGLALLPKGEPVFVEPDTKEIVVQDHIVVLSKDEYLFV